MKYIDLHIHTKYTKDNSVTEIDELINKVKEYKMDSIAIVDSGNMSGVPEFYIKSIKNNIKPIIGLGFYFAKDSRFSENDEKYHIVLLAKNNNGYKNLLKLGELSFKEGFYKRPRIDFELLEKYNEDLICLSGGLGGLIDKFILCNRKEEAIKYINKFVNIFEKDRFYLELQDNGLKNNETMIKELKLLSENLKLNLIVSGGSFYLNKEDASKCNELRKNNGNRELIGNGYYFKSSEEINNRFKELEEAINNTIIVSEMCNVNLDINKLKEIDYKNNSDLENIEMQLKTFKN